jgi:DDE superfamily endonuclease
VPAKNLIFIDESGAHLQMRPRYGRAYGRERAYLCAPYHRGHQITMIGAISIDKVEAAMYGQWATDGEVFTKFLEQSLRPMLNPNHVVVMDNVSFHKVQRVSEIIQQAGARLIYLPPYHPELNPIEEM